MMSLPKIDIIRVVKMIRMIRVIRVIRVAIMLAILIAIRSIVFTCCKRTKNETHPKADVAFCVSGVQQKASWSHALFCC